MASRRYAEIQSYWRARWQWIFAPRVVRQACIAAVVVGSLLVGLNQGDLIAAGHLTPRVVVKSLLTPIVPFCVTLLGAFLNSNTALHAEDLRPGWAAIRRSLVIAALVGSIIIALNQGDLILSGAVTPLVLTKILFTPCVPFCVSLYGAYIAYRSALTAQQL